MLHRTSTGKHYYPPTVNVFVGNYISWRDRIKSVIDALMDADAKAMYEGRADSQDFDD
jgi:hypothetical protein